MGVRDQLRSTTEHFENRIDADAAAEREQPMKCRAIYHAKAGGRVRFVESDTFEHCMAIAKAATGDGESLLALSELGDDERHDRSDLSMNPP